jgi:uncharacterized protein YerC
MFAPRDQRHELFCTYTDHLNNVLASLPISQEFVEARNFAELVHEIHMLNKSEAVEQAMQKARMLSFKAFSRLIEAIRLAYAKTAILADLERIIEHMSDCYHWVVETAEEDEPGNLACDVLVELAKNTSSQKQSRMAGRKCKSAKRSELKVEPQAMPKQQGSNKRSPEPSSDSSDDCYELSKITITRSKPKSTRGSSRCRCTGVYIEPKRPRFHKPCDDFDYTPNAMQYDMRKPSDRETA